MPSAALFLRDAGTGDAVRLATDDTISLSSEQAGWEGPAIARHARPAVRAPRGVLSTRDLARVRARGR